MARVETAARGNGRSPTNHKIKNRQIHLELDRQLPKAHGLKQSGRATRPRHASNRAQDASSARPIRMTPKTERKHIITPKTDRKTPHNSGRRDNNNTVVNKVFPAGSNSGSRSPSSRPSPNTSIRSSTPLRKQLVHSNSVNVHTERKASQTSGNSRRKKKKDEPLTSLLQDGVVGHKPEKGKIKDGKSGRGQRSGNIIKKIFYRHFGHLISAESLEFEDEATAEAVEALGLSNKQVRKLKSMFDSMDIDGSGSIDPDEFLGIMGEQQGPFTDALFELIDIDGSGTIDFEEYVRATITYCMYNKIDILKFCFDIFDLDRSGAIDEYEFIELVTVINGAAPLFPGNFMTALQQFDVNEDGLIDFHEFCEMDKRFPMIFFPAFRLQDQMQRNTLGVRAWETIHENIRIQAEVADYAAKHGGMEPPTPPLLMLKRKFLPCIYTKPRRIDTAVIDKHRPSRKVKKSGHYM